MDFACKEFDIDDIVKCGLGLTKAEFRVMDFLMRNDREFTTAAMAKRTRLNLTTIQKAVKKLSEKKVISRSQKNLDGGGYLFLYRSNPKTQVRQVLKGIIKKWSAAVEDRIDEW